jgi:tRNA (guanine-N7-)-methyltransferase
MHPERRPPRLAHLLVPWVELDWPIDWSAVFGRTAPLVLEIGAGNGEFLAAMAREHPARDHVGVEVSWTSTQRILGNIDRAGLANARALTGDARVVLTHCVAPASLAAVVVNHPDPWPKRRHWDRRLVQPGFLRLLCTRMAPGALLHVATDHEDYARWIARVLAGEAGLDEVERSRLDADAPTKFGRLAIAAGGHVQRFVHRRNDLALPVAATARNPTTFSDDMVNVILTGQGSTEGLLRDLRPCTFHERDGELPVVVSLLGSLRHMQAEHLLVEAHVSDGDFAQQLAVEIRPYHGGRLMVKLALLGRPRLTWGVKRAVYHTVRALLAENPNLSIEKSTLGPAGE